MAWLLRFASLDLENASQGQLLDLGYEVRWFPLTTEAARLLRRRDFEDQATVRAAHRIAGRLLEAVFGEHAHPDAPFEYTFTASTKWVVSVEDPRVADSSGIGIFRLSADSPVDEFASAAMTLVLRTGNRVRRCEYCKVLFMARPYQMKTPAYCSAKHSAAARADRFREKQRGDRPARPRGRPRKIARNDKAKNRKKTRQQPEEGT